MPKLAIASSRPKNPAYQPLPNRLSRSGACRSSINASVGLAMTPLPESRAAGRYAAVSGRAIVASLVPDSQTTRHSAPRQFRGSNDLFPLKENDMLRSCLAIALACAAAAPIPAVAAPVRSSTTQIDYATFRALAVETEA